MGYLGMILGYSAKFLLETIMMITILFIYADKQIFFIPKFKEICKDLKEIILFSLNFAIGYYTVSMTFELVSLILMKTENGKVNLLIWVSLAQIINAVYYIGYGVASYGRALGNHFIGVGDKVRFKDSLYKCVKYHSIITYLLNIPFFVFAPVIGEMFMTDEAQIKDFTFNLRVLAFFLPLDSMIPILNSFNRLLSHNFFTMVFMIIGFSCVITGLSYFLCFYYNSGAFGPTCGLIVCNIVVACGSLLRIYYNLDYYLDFVIKQTEEKNKKNLKEMAILEEAHNKKDIILSLIHI